MYLSNYTLLILTYGNGILKYTETELKVCFNIHIGFQLIEELFMIAYLINNTNIVNNITSQ